jgi:nucleotide sugar dehydrogenase
MGRCNNYKVCVVGVGFVGEHLLENFSRRYNVIGVDLSPQRIFVLKNKYRNHKNVRFQAVYDDLENCNVFLISVPTLVKENDIDMSYVKSAKESLNNIVKPGDLVMVESSVYVGATRELFSDFINRGIRVGFSPERVDPGRVEPPMKSIPKVISGLDEPSLEMCKDVYGQIFEKIVPVSSCECAEMCKLYENCFRMINIAYTNEISDMCDNLGINTYEMINASSTKPFGFMPFYPGLGVGGHCIPVNPYYLFRSGDLPVLKHSTELMEKRPVNKAKQLIDMYCPEKILVIGIGFKKGESLTTNSPGYSFYKSLINLGKDAIVYDPIVQNNYMKQDVQFLSEKDFNSEFLKNNFDLVVVNLRMEKHEEFAVSCYEKTGGCVHVF